MSFQPTFGLTKKLEEHENPHETASVVSEEDVLPGLSNADEGEQELGEIGTSDSQLAVAEDSTLGQIANPLNNAGDEDANSLVSEEEAAKSDDGHEEDEEVDLTNGPGASNGPDTSDEEKESWLQATNKLALQFGNFILNNREYAALGFIIFATLPLFNFASMGILAYVAMPILALAAMQVLYFEKTSSVLRDGIKLNTSYVNGILDLEQIKYNPKEEVKAESEEEVVDFSTGADAAETEGLLSENTTEENTYWEAFKSFNLVKLFSNLHPTVIANKWEEAGTKDSWADLGVNFAKIAVLYTGIYFAASAVTPFLVSPMHSLLALGGSYALVGSYFVALGLGYGLSYATDTKISEENTYWVQGSGIAALTAVAALATVAILFAPATWWTTLLAAPGALAAVAPSIIALAALGAYTTNAINAKGPEMPVGNGDNDPESSTALVTGVEEGNVIDTKDSVTKEVIAGQSNDSVTNVDTGKAPFATQETIGLNGTEEAAPMVCSN